uniref:Exocyst complex component Sec3 PIP2-binding N-terminal domain-containing protein n=1 Tax=Aegilops tauschii TaxID=37682 RepID=M8C463_AEGTA
MARSSADDMELKRACEAGILSKEKAPEKVVMSMRVAKGRTSGGTWAGKAGKLATRHSNMAKPRVLAVTTKPKGQKTKAFLRVLKYSNGGILEPAKVYKIKHLHKVEVASNDPSGCTFILGFDNLRSQSVSPPQWTMRNKDDRNRLLMCVLNLCKELLGGIPKVVGMDIVEMAIWAKENTTTKVAQAASGDGLFDSTVLEPDSQVAVENDLVSQAEEEDIEALLGTYVMAIGEAEAFSERMKRELVALESANVYALMETESVVEEIEWRNNRLEMQSYEVSLTGGSFDEGNMVKNIEACEWLTSAIKNLEGSNLDPCYAKLRAVREKRAEFVLLKCTFVRRASEFLRNYFPSLIDSMLNDKDNFTQKGLLQRPDHADMRYKCRTYARLLQFIKSLDKSCMIPLRKAYCHSLNLLIRREAREYSNELRNSSKASKSSTPSFEGPAGANQPAGIADSPAEAYSKMITAFIPLLVDENYHLTKTIFQEDFYAIVDWAFKLDPLSCIPMHGITDRYIAAQFVDDACFQVEKYERNVKQVGVVPYIPRFSQLAARMEQYITGSRDLVDQAYTKIVTIMFVTLEKIAQVEPKYADIVLLENYAAFQHSLYDLANVVPTLAKYYHQASEAYEQACSRHINLVIYIHFEKLFQFARKIEEQMYNMSPEEIAFQVGMSKVDFRKMLKSSLTGLDKTITAMYRKLQKNMTAEELLPSLWEKCKKEFLDKYTTFLKLIAKIYPNETVTSVNEMRDILANL